MDCYAERIRPFAARIIQIWDCKSWSSRDIALRRVYKPDMIGRGVSYDSSFSCQASFFHIPIYWTSTYRLFFLGQTVKLYFGYPPIFWPSWPEWTKTCKLIIDYGISHSSVRCSCSQPHTRTTSSGVTTRQSRPASFWAYKEIGGVTMRAE